MSKSNFLLVDLNESKTKKLAETITSDTSRKILNHLSEKEHGTELNISTALELPISTVHYHLQKLVEAKLVEIQEFHYSVKGREVNHYKLANKYIIIAPKKTSGLKQKLRGLLPVIAASVGISAVIKLVQSAILSARYQVLVKAQTLASKSIADAVESAQLTARELPIATPSPNIALWFLIGSLSAIVLYLVISWIREKITGKS